MKLVIASQNRGKIREFASLLSPWFSEVISMGEAGLTESPEETGETFAENALLKAEFTARCLGVPALADDSGLEVEALNGAPGVHSARFAGEPCDDAANNQKLLRLMKGQKNRKARFVSCIVLYDPVKNEVLRGEGEVSGRILEAPKGENGFGYDCLFYSEELGKSFGEASAEEKNRISHRARALNELMKQLRARV